MQMSNSMVVPFANIDIDSFSELSVTEKDRPLSHGWRANISVVEVKEKKTALETLFVVAFVGCPIIIYYQHLSLQIKTDLHTISCRRNVAIAGVSEITMEKMQMKD